MLTAEVSFSYFVRLRQFCAGTAEGNTTGFQNISTICDLQRLTCILLNQQNGRATVMEFLNDGEHLKGGFFPPENTYLSKLE